MTDEKDKEVETLDTRDFDAEIEEIIDLIEEKKYSRLRSILLENNAVDIAEMIENVNDRLGLDKAILTFRMLPKDVSVEVFAYLPEEDQVEVINGVTQREIDHIIEELAFDDMIDLLEELPANLVDKILLNTTKEERSLINTFLNYPENSAGSLMTIDYIDFKVDMTVRQCLEHIKEAGLDSETVYTCYVMDRDRMLLGVVSLRALVMADGDEIVADIMHDDPMSINVLTDQEEVSNIFKRYGILALPVVDKEGRLVGIITVDDIFDVIDDEVTEDFQRMAGVTGDSDEDYLDMSVFKHARNRLPWLFILMISYIFTGNIIANVENLVAAIPALVIYMPMVMGTGGNSGSQSATLIIRGLATEDIEVKDFLRVLWKEFRTSIIVGVVLSLLNMARIVFLDRRGFLVALTVSASMCLVVMVAKMVGSMLPIIAKKIGIDPALMAGPLVSSLTDMISLAIYFQMATMILNL
ncbi:MAG: magnesium transporter [Anaerovoracaceae bacterium]|nr:magnesium transporter [Bacillota bacterium]MDD7733427.1 magnesium transporter [Bacillota bacterium]MDY5905782.1 magnesium transporter [Anaerovoracaceae bacterium]